MFDRGIYVRHQVDLAKSSWLKLGGTAQFVVYPKSILELKSIIKTCEQRNFSYWVIGETSNIIFLDNEVYDVLISMTLFCNLFLEKDKDFCDVDAGVNLIDFVRNLHSFELSGFEGLEGIPGTIGGALYMNAGAYGYTIFDNLEFIKFFEGNQIKIIKKSSLLGDLSYRHGFQLKGAIILQARFKLPRKFDRFTANKIQKFHQARHLSQEFSYPTVGSNFKSNVNCYDAVINSYLNRVLYKILVRCLYNRVVRWFVRPKFSRVLLNKIVFRENPNLQKHLFSSKNINTAMNRNATSLDIISNLYNMKKASNGKLQLENKIFFPSGLCKELLHKIKYLSSCE